MSRSSRILLLDDHLGSIVAVRHALALRGHQCAWATTLADAVARSAHFQPDAVLYEWNLGRESRVVLIGWLRAIARTCHLFAVSTLDEPAGFRTEYAARGYLTKPVDVEALQRALDREGAAATEP